MAIVLAGRIFITRAIKSHGDFCNVFMQIHLQKEFIWLFPPRLLFWEYISFDNYTLYPALSQVCLFVG